MHRHARFLVSTLLLLLAPLPILAAEAKEPASQESQTFLSMIEKSGTSGIIFFGLLGLLSMATVAVILERFVSLGRRKVIPPLFVGELRQVLGRGSVGPEQLRDLCQRFPSPTVNVLKAG